MDSSSFISLTQVLDQWLLAMGHSTAVGLDSKFFLAVLSSLLLGLAIGAERSYNGRAAGMRTYALVSLTGAVLCAASVHPELMASAHVIAGIDPTRTVQGIMTGIGFLGAGLIIRENFSIRGLTSAACIWSAAGVGVLCGLHLIGEAVLVTLCILLVLIGIRLVEPLIPHRTYSDLMITIPVDCELNHETIVQWITDHGFTVMSTSYSQTEGLYRMQMILRGGKHTPLEPMGRSLRNNRVIQSFELLPRKD